MSDGLDDSEAHGHGHLCEIELTRDAFLGGAVIARQPRHGYRAGVDAVLLAAAVEDTGATPFRVLDLGAGVGVVGLCIAARLVEAKVTLVEREPALTALARANIAEHGLEPRVSVVEADLTSPDDSKGLEPGSFDHVVANPPFHDPAAMRLPRDRLRAAAHAMPDGALDDWLRAMARLARPGGKVTLIHKADALPDLLSAFGRRFGGIEIRPVHPREGAAANRLLIEATKGSRAPLRILPQLVLHDETNAFRPEIARMLRGPVGLADTAARPDRKAICMNS
jgi:tRNA1(Val) A37 N6-methylase TrmN6